MKMVELHCHFDGSLDIERSYYWAKKRGVVDESMDYDTFSDLLEVKTENCDLVEYLRHFELPTQLLQDPEVMTDLMVRLVRDLNKEGIVYAEVRFAPQLHIRKGHSQEEAIQALIAGVEQAKELYPDTHINLIACVMIFGEASLNYDLNMETVELCGKYLGKGICAMDMAGAEGTAAMDEFRPFFERAKELGVPFTIHAGEAGGPDHVAKALEWGASRIGHGGHSTYDPELVKKLTEVGIPLEICITSNVHCHNQPSFEGHAIRELYDAGVHVTLNTDNRTLSRIDLHHEVEVAKKYLKFTDEDIRKMMLYAVDGIFADEAEKERCRKLINEE